MARSREAVQARGNGIDATIPGGENLIAQTYGQTVVGVLSIPGGSMLPGGSPNDDPIFIVGNGILGSQSNAFEVSYNGHSTVFHNTGGATPVIAGATYLDDIVYELGNVTGDGDCICDFGVRNIKHLGAGWHQIEMDLADEDGNVVQLNCGSVPATISSKRLPGEGWSDAYRHISVSQIVNSVVDDYNGLRK
ncbi:MAG: hypothetical protein ABIR47_00785 [Candidatus Kapaibacterium sp.]